MAEDQNQASVKDPRDLVDPNFRYKLRAVRISLAVSIVLFLIKCLAYRLTLSTAVLSDAAESVINILAAGFAYFSVSLASKPADENHPYGHGKIEYFSAGFEGGLIVLAAIGIIVTSIAALFAPAPLTNIDFGLALTLAASAVNGLTGWYLLRVGKSVNSKAIEADGRHLIVDVWTSVGVLFGLTAVYLTGWNILDPLVALILGLHILYSGWQILRDSAGHLMDEADEELLDRIVERLDEIREPGDLSPHYLRSARYGPMTQVDFHIFLPRFWTLTQVHDRSDAIERALREDFGKQFESTIHIDPCRDSYCSRCDLADCDIRSAAFVAREAWTRADVASQGEHPEEL